MLDLNNLYWEEEQNIGLIKSTAQRVWGNNVRFGEIKVIDSPYPEFELIMRLYNKINIMLVYDRSTLDIGIPKDGEYVLMDKFTDEPFVRGMRATQPDNLVNNFALLDKVVKNII